jgi:hypothetical protein
MTTKKNNIEDQLIQFEKELHSSLTRANYARLNELLSDDFYEFGSSGNVWKKNDILIRLPSEDKNAPQIESKNFTVKQISDEVYFLTYVSFRMINGKEERVALRSSLWKKHMNNWQMFFHQGTFKA